MGKTHLPEYGVWWQMWNRCSNPDSEYYHRYGGRGIRVCKRWASFEVFLTDVGRRPSAKHTIERRNNNRGYSPGNVYWATRTAQARNRESNVHLTYAGRRQTIAAWGDETGLGGKLISQRINELRWSVAKSLTTPAACKPKNVKIRAKGRNKTANEWEAVYGVPAYQILRRIANGWDTDRAVSEPLKRYN